MRASIAITAVFLLTALTTANSRAVDAQEERKRSPIIVTEDMALGGDGCDAVSIFDGDELESIHSGDTYHSPGRLTANPELSLIVSSPSNGWFLEDERTANYEPFLYFTEKNDQAPSGWRDGVLIGAEFASNGAIVMLPEDGEALVTTARDHQQYSRFIAYRGVPPYRLSRATIPKGGPPVRRIRVTASSSRFDAMPAEVMLDPDGRTAHIVTTDARLHSLNIDSLTESDPPIELQPYQGDRDPFFTDYSNLIHAIQSPDGRYIVTNRWESNLLNVADLVQRRAWTVELDADVKTIGGIALNGTPVNGNVLAVHSGSRVLTYEWQSVGRLVELGELDVGREPATKEQTGPSWAIAWTEEGDRLVAAVDAIDGEFMVIDVLDGGRTLAPIDVLETCSTVKNYANDIWTRSFVLPTFTPTTVPSATLSPTPTATAEQTPTATVTPSPTSVQTSTPAPSRTPTATPSPTPGPIYLPILLREHCTPDQRRTDVVLVVDASSSMLDETATGRTKLVAAVAAAGTFLDQLELGDGDQAAIVSFNAVATVHAELTSHRPTLNAAMARIDPASQTCLVCGVEAGALELASTRRRSDNTPLLIVLTDGLSNPRPSSEAVDRAAQAKNAGVIIHTIGLGDTLDFDALEAIASEPAYFHRAPGAEDLAAIYQHIAVEIPCPPSRYWGRR